MLHINIKISSFMDYLIPFTLSFVKIVDRNFCTMTGRACVGILMPHSLYISFDRSPSNSAIDKTECKFKFNKPATRILEYSPTLIHIHYCYSHNLHKCLLYILRNEMQAQKYLFPITLTK